MPVGTVDQSLVSAYSTALTRYQLALELGWDRAGRQQAELEVVFCRKQLRQAGATNAQVAKIEVRALDRALTAVMNLT